MPGSGAIAGTRRPDQGFPGRGCGASAASPARRSERSQTKAIPSAPADTNDRPSGAKATTLTDAWCPSNRRSSRPVARSQIRTVASRTGGSQTRTVASVLTPPEASHRPSGEKASPRVPLVPGELPDLPARGDLVDADRWIVRVPGETRAGSAHGQQAAVGRYRRARPARQPSALHLASDVVPDRDAAAPRDEHPPAVGGEEDAGIGRGLPPVRIRVRERPHDPAGRHVPGLAPGYQGPAVRREGQAVDGALRLVVLESADQPPPRDVPERHAVEVRRDDQRLPVGGDRHPVDVPGEAGEDPPVAARGGIPFADRAVETRGEDRPAVGRDDQVIDRRPVPVLRDHLTAIGHAPHPDDDLDAGRGERPAVGREVQGVDPALVRRIRRRNRPEATSHRCTPATQTSPVFIDPREPAARIVPSGENARQFIPSIRSRVACSVGCRGGGGSPGRGASGRINLGAISRPVAGS